MKSFTRPDVWMRQVDIFLVRSTGAAAARDLAAFGFTGRMATIRAQAFDDR
jgi:hypothetical protein